MKIEVPLEIGDVIWIIIERESFPRTIKGVNHMKYREEIRTTYILEKYSDINIDRKYYLSKKDAEIEITKKILDKLKNED